MGPRRIGDVFRGTTLGMIGRTGGTGAALPPSAIDVVVVVVPARDEGELIDGCLDALERATRNVRAARPSVRVETLVVLDACRDETRDRVDARPWVDVVSCVVENVGAARSLGISQALSHIRRPDRCWIANTDADSRVPGDWLTGMVDFADRGADLVLGTVWPDDLPTSMLGRWLQRHQLVEGHPHIHGANLGVRAAAYAQLGGFAPLRSGEDVDLVRRAVQAGRPIVRTAMLPVATSGRRHGRAPNGFADYLDELGRGSRAGSSTTKTS